MTYRLYALVALLGAVKHILFGRPVQVAKFGILKVEDDSKELSLTNFSFHDDGMIGSMRCDGVSSETHPELLNRAAIAVAITILIGVFCQPRKKDSVS